MKFVIKNSHVWLAVGGWFFLALGGLGAMWAYAFQHGAVGVIEQRWPVQSAISRSEDQPTLLLFAHPQCPCTRATLEELSKIAAKTNGRIEIRVVFVDVPGTSQSMSMSRLWKIAASIPNTTVVRDVFGVEALRFGAKTSGHAFLYARGGDLVFQGGITASRGHVGDNEGSRAIAMFALADPTGTHSTPVYGCPLFDEPAL